MATTCSYLAPASSCSRSASVTKPFLPLEPVVGHDDEVLRGILQFVHEDGEADVAEADDHVHLCAQLSEGHSLRVGDGDAQTAADDGHALAFDVAVLADADRGGRRSPAGCLPAFSSSRWMVVLPTFWKMMVTLPLSRS